MLHIKSQGRDALSLSLSLLVIYYNYYDIVLHFYLDGARSLFGGSGWGIMISE